MSQNARHFFVIMFAALLSHAGVSSKLEAADTTKRPLKVFILAGQSNMQGHASIKTIDAMQYNPRSAPLLNDIQNSDGSFRVCEKTWIASLGSADVERIGLLSVGFGAGSRGEKIGPEYTFGIYMAKLLDEPILIIKTAWGGKSLNTDFRPPSAGPYVFNQRQLENYGRQGKDIEKIKSAKTAATGKYYHEMIAYIKSILGDIQRVVPDYKPEQGYDLAGFVWFQGWNDMVDRDTYPNRDQPGGYDQYSELLSYFIRDVRNDLSAPKLPFVIGVMGVGGPTTLYDDSQRRYQSVHQNFRNAMAAPAVLPEFDGNVAAILTENYWDMRVVDLRRREKSLKPRIDEIKQSVEQGRRDQSEANAAVDRLYAENFDEQEMLILKTSVSNAEYHYLGSATIMTQIGKGFAEAMAKLQ